MLTALLITIVFIPGIIGLITLSFQNNFFVYLSLYIVVILKYIDLMLEVKYNIHLIEERIERRTKKNLKQQKKGGQNDDKTI